MLLEMCAKRSRSPSHPSERTGRALSGTPGLTLLVSCLGITWLVSRGGLPNGNHDLHVPPCYFKGGGKRTFLTRNKPEV